MPQDGLQLLSKIEGLYISLSSLFCFNHQSSLDKIVIVMLFIQNIFKSLYFFVAAHTWQSKKEGASPAD